MSTQSKLTYARPPVLEAVIGITFSQPLIDKALATADKRLANHYLVHTDNKHVDLLMNTTMGIDNRPVVGAQGRTTLGHRRATPNQDEVAILMPDSFTVSQLAPYTGWDTFFARFQRDFAIINKVSNRSQSISRVGMRYINRVDVPAVENIVEFERFVDIYPRVPDSLGPMVGFNMQAQFALGSIDGQANINTMPMQPVTLRHASFLLDIDVYKTFSTPLPDKALYSLLQQMRLEKNRIFEACVTQRAREELFSDANH